MKHFSICGNNVRHSDEESIPQCIHGTWESHYTVGIFPTDRKIHIKVCRYTLNAVIMAARANLQVSSAAQVEKFNLAFQRDKPVAWAAYQWRGAISTDHHAP